MYIASEHQECERPEVRPSLWNLPCAWQGENGAPRPTCCVWEWGLLGPGTQNGSAPLLLLRSSPVLYSGGVTFCVYPRQCLSQLVLLHAQIWCSWEIPLLLCLLACVLKSYQGGVHDYLYHLFVSRTSHQIRGLVGSYKRLLNKQWLNMFTNKTQTCGLVSYLPPSSWKVPQLALILSRFLYTLLGYLVIFYESL